MIGIVYASAIGLLLTGASAPEAKQSEVANLKRRMNLVKENISSVQNAIVGIEKTRERLVADLNYYEKIFSRRFEQVLIPLLNWPTTTVSARVPSWVEQGHFELIVRSVRGRLSSEPLELISDRESKIQQSERMKENYMASLKELEAKQVMLSLQLEELEALQKKRRSASKAGRIKQKSSQSGGDTSLSDSSIY